MLLCKRPIVPKQAPRSLIPCTIYRRQFTLQPLLSAAEKAFVTVNETFGLPWWASIPLSTILLRSSIMLPLKFYQKKLIDHLPRFKALGWAHEGRRMILKNHYSNKFRTEQKVKYYMNNDFKDSLKLLDKNLKMPVWPIYVLPLLQVTLFFISSITLRGMCGHPLPATLGSLVVKPELATGGIGFIPNLLQPDTLGIIPIGFLLINTINIELSTNKSSQFQNPALSHQKSIFTQFFRVVGYGSSIFISYLANYTPSAISLYWISSASFSLAEKFLSGKTSYDRYTIFQKDIKT